MSQLFAHVSERGLFRPISQNTRFVQGIDPNLPVFAAHHAHRAMGLTDGSHRTKDKTKSTCSQTRLGKSGCRAHGLVAVCRCRCRIESRADARMIQLQPAQIQYRQWFARNQTGSIRRRGPTQKCDSSAFSATACTTKFRHDSNVPLTNRLAEASVRRLPNPADSEAELPRGLLDHSDPSG